MSASFYYSKMRGDTAFTLNDLERLSGPLGVHPVELARHGAALGGSALEPLTQLDRKQLASRVMELMKAPLPDGGAYSLAALTQHAELSGVPFSESDLSNLLSGDGDEPVSIRQLQLLTSLWEVPEKYLTDLSDTDALDSTSAHLEFRAALVATGATTVAARAVGEVSPSALRAIAQSLRSITL